MPSTRQQAKVVFLLEVSSRVFLLVFFIYLERCKPFIRVIHPEEMWLYKNPRTSSYIPVQLLWTLAVLVPLGCIAINTVLNKDSADVSRALKVFTLIFGLNGVITNLIKLTVGRPRPDFFWRCFPDGNGNDELNCSGNYNDIIEGRKSFPSGHASYSFACMGFVAFYIASKLNVFSQNSKNRSERFLLFLTPLIVATLMAVSRTCDYHHHWQDVTVGAIIGTTISYVCFRLHYPPLTEVSNHSKSSISAETSMNDSSSDHFIIKTV